MSKQQSEGGNNLKSLFAAIVIPVAVLVGFAIWRFVMGDPNRFQDHNNELLPLPGEILGNMYKGGVIVPILIGCFITVLTFSIERFITIGKSKGTGNIESFIRKVRSLMSS